MIKIYQSAGKGLYPATLHYRRGKTTKAFCHIPKVIQLRAAERSFIKGGIHYFMYKVDAKEFVIIKYEKGKLKNPKKTDIFIACRKEMELFWKGLAQ